MDQALSVEHIPLLSTGPLSQDDEKHKVDFYWLILMMIAQCYNQS